jgi:hypothetical protein
MIYCVTCGSAIPEQRAKHLAVTCSQACHLRADWLVRLLDEATAARHAILSRDGYQCVYCKGQSGDEQLVLDHMVPRCQAGGSGPNNLVAACRRCNSIKALSRLSQEDEVLAHGRAMVPVVWTEGMTRAVAHSRESRCSRVTVPRLPTGFWGSAWMMPSASKTRRASKAASIRKKRAVAAQRRAAKEQAAKPAPTLSERRHTVFRSPDGAALLTPGR